MTTDEDKISSIYQQGNEQGPPAHLDNVILNAAHEAVEQAPSADNLSVAKGPFAGGWRATVSIAAVLVITVILVPLIEQEEPVPDALDTPMDEIELLQKQSQPQETAVRENVQLRKEKAKKRVLLNAPKAQSEERSKINQYSVVPELDSAGGRIEEEERSAPVRSATPASMAADYGKQQEPKSEVVGRQKSLLMMDSYFSEEAIDVDDLTPQQWLDKIRQLIAQGEMEAAKKELDAFSLRYPDEVVEPSILEKIRRNR